MDLSFDGTRLRWAGREADSAAVTGFSLAGEINGISRAEQKFFKAGGLGILAGDGNLNYGWEKILETYYDFQIWKGAHAAVDYQFVDDPAFNRDRGPVSVFAVRFHVEF